MPIAFHDDESVHRLGFAAYLHLKIADSAACAAVLFLNARGEPQEFVYNRLELLSPELWRGPDRVTGAARRLCASLFSSATLTPQFLLYSPENFPPEVFRDQGGVRLEIPVGAVTVQQNGEDSVGLSTIGVNGEIFQARIEWLPRAPAGELLPLLAKRGLLLEPFGRLAAGLCEVYPELFLDLEDD